MNTFIMVFRSMTFIFKIPYKRTVTYRIFKNTCPLFQDWDRQYNKCGAVGCCKICLIENNV